jgi:hypothetical protein
MGQRVVNPVANRVVNRFFSSVQDKLHETKLAEGAIDAADADDDSGLISKLLGRSDSDSTT